MPDSPAIEARLVLGSVTVDGKSYPVIEDYGVIQVAGDGRMEHVVVVQTKSGDKAVILDR